MIHLSLEERLRLVTLRSQLVVLVCLSLLGNGLFDLNLAGLLGLLRFRGRCLVFAGGRLAGALFIIVVVYGFELLAH